MTKHNYGGKYDSLLNDIPRAVRIFILTPDRRTDSIIVALAAWIGVEPYQLIEAAREQEEALG